MVKNIKKLFVGVLVSMTILVTIPTGAYAEWRQTNTGWWYSQGNSYAIGWKSIDRNWYYFDSNGYMRTGWIAIDGTWYYFYDNGTMATNSTVPGGAVDTDGKWIPTSYHNVQVQNAENDTLENYGKPAPGTKIVIKEVKPED